jgi:hypothetical protein
MILEIIMFAKKIALPILLGTVLSLNLAGVAEAKGKEPKETVINCYKCTIVLKKAAI